MADISQIKMPNNEVYDIKDAVARASINGIFTIAWNGSAAPTVANIPLGVVVKYNSTNYTGTKVADASTLGKFYLVKSTTQQDPTLSDIYDEYVTVLGGTAQSPTYSWEKIGDTQIKLTEVVTNVTLDKTNKTANVIGASSTLKVTTAPTYTVTPNSTYVAATATGANVSYSPTNDNKDTFLKKVTANTKKLATTTVTGVSGSTTASKVSEDTAQTTAKGTGTASTSTDAWIKGWSVSNELLTLGGVTMDTQLTKQIKIDTESVTVPKAATSATRVATGSLADSDSNGGTIATGVTTSGTGYTAAALVSLPTPTITQPTISLSTNSDGGTGQAEVAAATLVNATNTNVGAVGWNSKDLKTVLLNTVDVNVTHAT